MVRQGKLLEPVRCRNTRCSRPNGKRSCRLTPSRVSHTACTVSNACFLRGLSAASRSGFCDRACMVNRELSCHGSRLVFYLCRLLLPFPLGRLIRRLFYSHLRGCMAGWRPHNYSGHEGIAIFAHAGTRLSTRAQRGRRVSQSA
ncbi:hypothetical protein EJ02DRAFT_19655 [Clathrospora elynae]|uniref:Uncharacterized protein n=1 Tax=Clathrospora elynae TaxID=706981 RepID=A0A6A5SEU0_9PLEO|nr:hypothetical protein EJ02DRAFT_19655 [Clathrospora elynae]